jgi:hypothetical protein
MKGPARIPKDVAKDRRCMDCGGPVSRRRFRCKACYLANPPRLKLSAETRAKMSLSHLGKKLSPEHIRRAAAGNTGKRRPWQAGDKHWNWRGGICGENRLIRQSIEYKTWRKHVFQRDDFKCQACGKRGGPLEADHELPFAYFPDLRFEILNGRTLCKPCHRKTTTFAGRSTNFATI